MLTKQERKVLCFVALGKTSKDIAKILFLSVSTIETHRKNITKQLGSSNASDWTHYALEKGFIVLSNKLPLPKTV